jgi:hypothetical protein
MMLAVESMTPGQMYFSSGSFTLSQTFLFSRHASLSRPPGFAPRHHAKARQSFKAVGNEARLALLAVIDDRKTGRTKCGGANSHQLTTPAIVTGQIRRRSLAFILFAERFKVPLPPPLVAAR